MILYIVLEAGDEGEESKVKRKADSQEVDYTERVERKGRQWRRRVRLNLSQSPKTLRG